MARLLGRSKKCHRGIDVSSNADLARAAAREGAIPPPLEKEPRRPLPGKNTEFFHPFTFSLYQPEKAAWAATTKAPPISPNQKEGQGKSPSLR